MKETPGIYFGYKAWILHLGLPITHGKMKTGHLYLRFALSVSKAFAKGTEIISHVPKPTVTLDFRKNRSLRDSSSTPYEAKNP